MWLWVNPAWPRVCFVEAAQPHFNPTERCKGSLPPCQPTEQFASAASMLCLPHPSSRRLFLHIADPPGSLPSLKSHPEYTAKPCPKITYLKELAKLSTTVTPHLSSPLIIQGSPEPRPHSNSITGLAKPTAAENKLRPLLSAHRQKMEELGGG